MKISDGAIIKCRHESCVKVVNKSNVQSKPIYRHPFTSNIIGYRRGTSNGIFKNSNLTYVNEEQQASALILIRYVSSINMALSLAWPTQSSL
jgi:hypothetical protein